MLAAGCQVIPKTDVATAPPPAPAPEPSATALPTDTGRHRIALLVPMTGTNAGVGQSIANATTLADLARMVDQGLAGGRGLHAAPVALQQRYAQPCGLLGKYTGCGGVDGEGQRRFVFGLVDCGIGGRIDDQPGTLTHHCRNLLGLRDVQLGPCRRQHLQPETCCPFHQFSTHLAAGTANEDSHSL